VPNGIVCGDADIGECSEAEACTYSLGFYKNNPTITNSLIEDAGGTVLLGDGEGLTVTADTSNAIEILKLNPPTPPAPDLPPYKPQYAELYAQLLTAKLNILTLTAMGVDVCPYAVAAIEAADAFIGDSPVGGMDGAPDVQLPLTRFNEGTAPGCPFNCE
jgi:hypothetical protein